MNKPAASPSRPYQICSRCILDTTDPDIAFDREGVCNHCRELQPLLEKIRLTPEESERRIEAEAERVRAYGKGKPYDCLLGLSGGVDSSYLAYLSNKLGLRPLVAHFDNGWNSELAVSNIHTVVKKFGFDLQTYVIDWEEFRDLQRAFLKASVIDIELLTDHAIVASMFHIARENGIRFVLSGTNLANESGMPRSWTWWKYDTRNIKAIHKRFGERPLKSFPMINPFLFMVYRFLGLGFEFLELLNLVNYKKNAVLNILINDLGWRPYPGKHYESIFTRFYQAYILPTKFGIDKRRVHYSSLIRNGEMTREAALEQIQEPLYDPKDLKAEKEYVLKKLGFTDAEFEAIMNEPPKPHDFYPCAEPIYYGLKAIKNRLFPHPGSKASEE